MNFKHAAGEMNYTFRIHEMFLKTRRYENQPLLRMMLTLLACGVLSSPGFAGTTSQLELTWDALGRLRQVDTVAGSSRFKYDDTTRRVRKTSPDGSEIVYVDKYMEVDNDGGVTKHIYAGDRRIASILPDGTRIYHARDHLQSTAMTTDESGALAARTDYAPFGERLANPRSTLPAGIRHTYTGQEADTETGLLYYGARYYDPVTAMFTSPDSVAPDPASPQEHNRYAYAGNSPMTFTDPSGHRKMFFGNAWYGNYVGPGTDISTNPDSQSVTDDIARNHDHRYAHNNVEFTGAYRLRESDPDHRSSRANLRWQQAKADALWIGDYVRRLDPNYDEGNGNYWTQIRENPWRGTRDLAVGSTATFLFSIQSSLALSGAGKALVPDFVEAITGSERAGRYTAMVMDADLPALWRSGEVSRARHKVERLYKSPEVTRVRHKVENVADKVQKTVKRISDWLF